MTFKRLLNKNILTLTGASAIGWLCGTLYEKRTKSAHLIAATVVTQSNLVPIEPAKDSSRTSQIMRFGFPSTDSIRVFGDYVLSYDRRNRTANWVFEHLTAKSVMKNPEVNRAKCEFKDDQGIHPFFQSTNKDYKGSGYDRGHLAAAGNHTLNQQYMDETFFLSNISPQVGQGFNRDAWSKLEQYVRNLTKTNKNVYVCTGPLYLPRHESDGKIYVKYEVIGSDHVSVPTHFFKVIVTEAENQIFQLESYVMPNQAIDDSVPLSAFHVPLESVERAAGLLFFDKLPNKAFKLINGKST